VTEQPINEPKKRKQAVNLNVFMGAIPLVVASMTLFTTDLGLLHSFPARLYRA